MRTTGTCSACVACFSPLSGWGKSGTRWLGLFRIQVSPERGSNKKRTIFLRSTPVRPIFPAAAWPVSGVLTGSPGERAYPHAHPCGPLPLPPPHPSSLWSPPTTSSLPKGLRERDTGPGLPHLICLEAPRCLGSILSKCKLLRSLRACPPLPLSALPGGSQPHSPPHTPTLFPRCTLLLHQPCG